MTVDTVADAACPWCDGLCGEVDLTTLLDERIHWLWRQLATVADRRGDRNLTTGRTTVTMPADAAHRAAAIGLLDIRTPKPGQRFAVDLARLTEQLRARHHQLTPGLVAGHAVRRILAVKADAQAARQATIERIRVHTAAACDRIATNAPVRPQPEHFWPALHRTGWIARIAALPHPEALIDNAIDVITALPRPGHRLDRRRLAETITGSPHALDAGTLPSLVLGILDIEGIIPPGLRNRDAWAAAGIDCDDLTGGLTVLGIYPAGWVLPMTATVTLTPRELARCAWPAPPRRDCWIFVTENPSVATAAADLAETHTASDTPLRLLCTVGTPSRREIDAIARLATTGWNIAVRADFDEAGIHHVTALLDGIPGAIPWRMGSQAYQTSLFAAADTAPPGPAQSWPATPWDPSLHDVMTTRGQNAYEESLIGALLADLRAGRPGGAVDDTPYSANPERETNQRRHVPKTGEGGTRQ